MIKYSAHGLLFTLFMKTMSYVRIYLCNPDLYTNINKTFQARSETHPVNCKYRLIDMDDKNINFHSLVADLIYKSIYSHKQSVYIYKYIKPFDLCSIYAQLLSMGIV